MRNLVRDISEREPTSPEFIRRVGDLRDVLRLHVTEEERSVFPGAEQFGIDELEAMGRRLEERKRALMASTAPENLRPRKTPLRLLR